jgi:hypothetical protein
MTAASPRDLTRSTQPQPRGEPDTSVTIAIVDA